MPNKDVADYFSAPTFVAPCHSSEENDKGHDRLAQLVAYSSQTIDWLEKEHQWPGLKSFGVINF